MIKQESKINNNTIIIYTHNNKIAANILQTVYKKQIKMPYNTCKPFKIYKEYIIQIAFIVIKE